VPKREQLREWLRAADIARIDPAARDRIARELAPVSAGHLRKLLLESGAALDPLVEGVRQDSFDHAERTLCALSAVYSESPRQSRALVVQAKDHARLALRRTTGADARAQRQELIEWMIVWVNDPPLFPTWVRIRRRIIESRSPSHE
jgi:hypothetical protein